MGLLGLSAGLALGLGWSRTGRSFLLIGFFIKGLLFLLDYRMMGNYHMIGFYFAAVFFLRPSVSSLQLLFVLVYFFAGLLKLNLEWLSGAALYGNIPGLKGESLAFATGFVVILELIACWQLLSTQTIVRWSAWISFVVFHLISIFVVGFFYPAVMLTLLLFFPYCWQRNLNFRRVELKSPGTLVGFVVITSFQLIPSTLILPSLTGEGRYLALNMFDAKAQCSVTMLERESDRTLRELDNPFRNIGFRIGCDPYLYFSHLKSRCSTNPSLQYSLYMNIRGNHDLSYPVVISETNMCREDIQYTWWKRNAWIQIVDIKGPSSVSLSSLFR